MIDLLAPPTISRERSWRASAVSPNTIVRTVQELWREVLDERRNGDRLARQLADGGMVRTQTINLIVLTTSDEQTESVRTLLNELHEFVPSRIIILQTGHDPNDDLDISVKVEERPRTPPAMPSRLEVIGVKARPVQLTSVALPLLVPELPDFVWCAHGNFAGTALVSDMARFADRIVVDSSMVAEPGTALRYLAGLIAEPKGEVRVSDLAWTRLYPWRQMIAQAFDAITATPCLETLEEVVIEYAETDDTGRSGATAGLLTAGWLATRLGWRAPGEELVRSRDGWKLTLRAGERGRRREVALLLHGVSDPAAAPGLAAVKLVAGGDAVGAFSVRRVSGEMLATFSEVPDIPAVDRTIYAPNRDDQWLLATELRSFGSDVVHEEALAFAANLWPDETDGP